MRFQIILYEPFFREQLSKKYEKWEYNLELGRRAPEGVRGGFLEGLPLSIDQIRGLSEYLNHQSDPEDTSLRIIQLV